MFKKSLSDPNLMFNFNNEDGDETNQNQDQIEPLFQAKK